jgi:cell division protein FtsI/penicillin-binding protein 2
VIGQETGGRPRYRTVKQDPARFKEPALARNRCVEDMYEPGSTFKPFMWSATTALGLAKPNEIFDTEDGFWKTPYGRPLKDVTVRGKQSWTDVLVNSSNIGMTKGTSRMSAEQMHAAVRGFGFGQPVKLGLPGESPGRVTSLKNWSKYTHTSVAMGYEVAVTPVQMVRAFSAFARTGEQAGTIPDVSLIAVSSDSAASRGTRVLPPEIAELTRKTMRGVAENLERKVLKNESQGYRYDAFGKSGTAQIPLPPRPKDRKLPKGVPGTGYFVGQYNVSFICGAPAESPRMVVLVVVDDPGPRLVRENRYYGAMVAGPVARRVVERSLAYMGVPPVTAETHTPVLAAAE